MTTLAVIPARFGSTRFPGKPLADLCGKPLIAHVIERARESKRVDDVIVATDDERIYAAVGKYGARAVMTSRDCASGTDRIAEVVRACPGAEIIVNVQGDEPLMPADVIDRTVEALLASSECDVATAMIRIRDRNDFMSPHVVKVVCDLMGRALYFSRWPIPNFLRASKPDLEYAIARLEGTAPPPEPDKWRAEATRLKAEAGPAKMTEAQRLAQFMFKLADLRKDLRRVEEAEEGERGGDGGAGPVGQGATSGTEGTDDVNGSKAADGGDGGEASHATVAADATHAATAIEASESANASAATDAVVAEAAARAEAPVAPEERFSADAEIVAPLEVAETVPEAVQTAQAGAEVAQSPEIEPAPQKRSRAGESRMPQQGWKASARVEFWGLKHFGLYVYRREALLRFVELEPSPLERLEKLEQLRFLENGMRIRVIEAMLDSVGVDTPEDLERAKRLIEERSNHAR